MHGYRHFRADGPPFHIAARRRGQLAGKTTFVGVLQTVPGD
ncbi:hypothetical protein Pan44_36230 [Caulifigura coniformis]|uniref:Uncharacterized protein n=1 Tax=Caulifigura coniformis TaxID=2527983 RepID=A0A517SHG6_9PLAN|nr:hypothetical protein Pan44_36230 [Caulifigura coniformis]